MVSGHDPADGAWLALGTRLALRPRRALFARQAWRPIGAGRSSSTLGARGTSGAWHECYHPDLGTPLSKESKGFISWTIMAAGLMQNLLEGVDPTAI